MASEATEVLIVGAGPTGLVLALWLARLGVHIRVIDKTAEPGTTSRALAVQARTLEFYRQLGLAAEVIDSGLKIETGNLWARGRKAAQIEFGRLGFMGMPYSWGLIFPQDEHERFLIAQLEKLGVRVERPVELLGFEDRGDRVVAHLEHSVVEASFLAGCDGARSTVREKLGIAFGGGTYEHLFYVADVEASGPQVDRQLHVSLDTSDFLAVFPLKAAGRVRLIGTVRRESEADKEPEWEDVGKDILQRLRIEVHRVNWFSTYHVHHRVAARFKQGRIFLLGDAAHIHSPVGGQGMNTGIGDAVNLGWKLAAVAHGRAPLRLLDTYEPERIAFARRLVASTDRVFQFVTRSGKLAGFVRVHVAPRIIGAAFHLQPIRRLMFRTLSQANIKYRHSDLSEGRAGNIHGGDRLPWIGPDPDNFAPLQSLDWQVHVYGTAIRALADFCVSRRLPLHVFPPAQLGEAMFLVRPDGYVALANPSQSPAMLASYLDRHGMT